MTYSDVVSSFRSNPREVPTAPKEKNCPPKWFYAYAHGNSVFVGSGKDHPNASRIFPDRKLPESEFDTMLALYYRRKAGEPVSQEAKKSICQSYWFGVFSDMQP